MVKSCKECNAKLSAANKFCPECGKPVPKEIPKVQEIKQFPPILTLGQAVEFLNISRCHIYTLIKNEGLPWFPMGTRKRFITDELLLWAKNRSRCGGSNVLREMQSHVS